MCPISQSVEKCSGAPGVVSLSEGASSVPSGAGETADSCSASSLPLAWFGGSKAHGGAGQESTRSHQSLDTISVSSSSARERDEPADT